MIDADAARRRLDPTRACYSRREVANNILGCSERTLINLEQAGELKVRRIGRKVVIPIESIFELLRRDRRTRK